MGAYLSQPKTDKESTDERNEYLAVGASSMQGWRNNQEDAHNSILVYDEKTSFFAVYDGHGGAEVALYCADNLPKFLKNLEAYKNGEFEKALKEAFLGFDKTLLEPDVVSILKKLAEENGEGEAEESEDDADEDLAELHEESNLSLKEVLKRYGGKLDQQFKLLSKNYENGEENIVDHDDDDDDSENPSFANLKHIQDGQKPESLFLRGRRAAAVIAESVNKKVLDPESQPAGSSTSAAASKVDGPNSSRSTANMDTDEDATVSSTNNNVQKSVLTNHVEAAAKVEKEAEAEADPKGTKTATKGEDTVPDSSRIIKKNDQNGSVTSSENNSTASKSQVSTTAAPKKKEQQNGAAQRISASCSNSAASSSKSAKLKPTENSILMEDYSTDDDADYDETTNSEDDDDDDDDEEANADGDDEADDDEDDDEDEFDEDEPRVDDEETIRANEQFVANMIEEPGQDSGCTAVVALLHGRDLYVANAGDSRCVVSRNGKAIEMSFDHKPEDKEENERILKAGGRVSADGRVNGGLNLSRAIGDHAYKLNADLPAEEQMISALPDVRKLIITPEDEFMVLACDGIWNFMSSSEVVEFVRKRIDKNNPQQSMSKICEELFDNCLAPNTMGDGTGCDNMTAVIVRFQPSMQHLVTKLNPDEVEPLQTHLACAESSPTNAIKRIASSSLDEQNTQIKRLKTDNEEGNTSSATSSLITSSTTTYEESSKCVKMLNTAETTASSSSNASSISTSEACTTAVNNEPALSANECDSGVPDSSDVSAGPS